MELWDICSSEGVPTGRTIIKGEELKEGEYHIAVEAWILNSRKEFLIQKRSPLCIHFPNVWSLTAGRIQAGEDSLEGCLREVQEEIGLVLRKEELIPFARVNREDGSHMIWDVFVVKKDVELSQFVLDPQEVAEVNWVSATRLEEMILRKKIFVYPEMAEFFEQIKKKFY